MTTELSGEGLRALVGQELGVSGWVRVTQEAVDAYAALTGDSDWLHNDPERARHGPFGGTIVQGSFLLAHCVRFQEEIAPAGDIAYTLNYGFDRVRFLRPVPVGSRIRGRLGLNDIRARGDRREVIVFDVQIEVEGEPGPVLVAEWLGLAERGD